MIQWHPLTLRLKIDRRGLSHDQSREFRRRTITRQLTPRTNNFLFFSLFLTSPTLDDSPTFSTSRT